jgi:hypothetical protein
VRHPFYGRLLQLLLDTPWRVSASGAITLSAAQASVLRAAGFAATVGPWEIPPLPPEIVEPRRRLLPPSIRLLEPQPLPPVMMLTAGAASPLSTARWPRVRACSKSPMSR